MATVQELINELQDRIDNGLSPDAEVVGVFQPDYPLSSTEIYITDTQEIKLENADEADDENENESTDDVLYIGLGQGYNYASGVVYTGTAL